MTLLAEKMHFKLTSYALQIYQYLTILRMFLTTYKDIHCYSRNKYDIRNICA